MRKKNKLFSKWFDNILLGLTLLLLIIGLGTCLYYRITHPDATDFRCFLETWPFGIMAMSSFFFLMYWTNRHG